MNKKTDCKFFDMKHTQESASWKGFPGSRGPCPRNLGPGLILKSVTGTGTQIQNLRDLGLGPGWNFEKGIPGLNFAGLSRGLKNSGTRSMSRADP